MRVLSWLFFRGSFLRSQRGTSAHCRSSTEMQSVSMGGFMRGVGPSVCTIMVRSRPDSRDVYKGKTGIVGLFWQMSEVHVGLSPTPPPVHLTERLLRKNKKCYYRRKKFYKIAVLGDFLHYSSNELIHFQICVSKLICYLLCRQPLTCSC